MTASNPVEVLVQRRQTEAYLKAEPQMIALSRPTPKVKTAAGGKVDGVADTLDPQMFRVVPFKRRVTESESNIVEGTVTVSTYVLVGRWDADVKKDDEFVLPDGRYKVESVEPGKSYRTLAILEYRGVDGN